MKKVVSPLDHRYFLSRKTRKLLSCYPQLSVIYACDPVSGARVKKAAALKLKSGYASNSDALQHAVVKAVSDWGAASRTKARIVDVNEGRSRVAVITVSRSCLLPEFWT